jgi:alpha-L-rhamnosidase
VATYPEPREHERFLWDTGFHFGEWLEPGVEPSLDPARDNNEVATGYLAHSADLLSRIATTLDRSDDAMKYAAIAAGARGAWQVEQLTESGELLVQTQAAHVRALAFELVPDHLAQDVADRLAQLVERADGHLSTGFLSTGMLLPVLAEHGHLDTAYRLLFSTGFPSWLGMIDAGATTIWERWDGVDSAGTASGSLDHYSKGAVLNFLHQFVAGIRPAAVSTAQTVGWKKFVIAPKPGGGISSARAFHDGPFGRISASWTLEKSGFRLAVEVPPGTIATVELPDGTAHLRGPGTHVLS